MLSQGSSKKAKFAVSEMKASLLGSDIEIILADLPKGQRNIKTMEDQYSPECLSYGLEYFMMKFFVSKKWWGH